MGIWGSSAYGSRRPEPSRSVLSALIIGALVATGCSNRAGNAASVSTPPAEATVPPGTDIGTSPSTTAPPVTEPPGVTFGDLTSPCGPGSAAIADGQNGGTKLVLATGTDKGAEVAPGLNAEMYDAAVAFADWCNAQGGIGGLQIEVLDADARLFDVPSTMERICAQAFAMVGGGYAFDDQEFPRFHECGMIDVAGYAVTTAKSMSNGMAQALPNASNRKNAIWFQWAKENHPEDITHFATVYPDVLTTRIVEQQYVEQMDILGGFDIVDRIPYSAAGEANWTPIAQRLKEGGVTAMTFVGVPENLAPLLQAMDDLGYRPNLIIQEGGFYAPVLITRARTAAEGVVVRTNYAPLEEADRSPATADYLDMMATNNPDGKIGGLGIQATSAFLLFAAGAQACLEDNANVLERECVLSHVREITDWTGGGLHSPTNPGDNEPSACSVLMVVKDGRFERLYPELGSADDAGDGFACDPSSVLDLTADYGDPTAGVDPNR